MQFTLVVAIISLLYTVNNGLDIDTWASEIEKLSMDEKFVEEYYKWSFGLFSQPDYLYGAKTNFPCNISLSNITATTVHQLRPSDVKCIGAMGDSLTAALGAHAIAVSGLLIENRGLSWSVGGDHTIEKVLTLPNIIKNYNPNLEGYSTKFSIIVGKGQNSSNNGFNVAKSGDRSEHMPYQAQLLIERMRTDQKCNFESDWKVVTFFIGGNDLCEFCKNITHDHSPEQYMDYVRETLDILHSTMTRTFVNLVLVLDVRGVKELNSGGFVCQTLHKKTCPCAAFPTPEQAKILDDYIPRYHDVLTALVNSGRYERDDFTVVIQPFLSDTKLPRLDKPGHPIDFSYFAPDCFHFSGKGHSVAALSLWNNMLEPVGQKQTFWHIGEALECPTDERPYFFTSNNSVGVGPKPKKTSVPPVVASTIFSRRTTNGRSTPNDRSTENQQSFTVSPSKIQSHHGHRKPTDDNEDSSSFFYKRKLTFVAGIGLVAMFILILAYAIRRRENINLFVNRRHVGMTRPSKFDDDDEVDIWSRPPSSDKTVPMIHARFS
ncbi:unnamed protein product [Didymodactylos carnosus]|uniref:Phospholipase B1, membrane-associated n=1 Tax=Didymodactylos carnosus TaxID=1234261 RepID=A0A813SKL4_9BILA|nr:unnamed protein product [Didymodactylos carnosus]CAF0963312.1 unnamed protein product [Didymodactylos carnosus]CAF3586261.1 unnamed protein product [Didymodactylos carnosus]CAF3735919.1 unnamed protein product [Didymodactylos carnosus]